jgi:predicted hotdog family 3-hydroxylacyl-ACP dehydratase
MPLDPDELGSLRATTPPHLRCALPSLADVVPHGRPMLLLDEITSWDGQRVECRLVPRLDSPFVEAGRAPATLAIEYMAQCIAVYGGLVARARGEPVSIGYLAGARDVTLDADEFLVGEVLYVEASHIWGDDTLGSFACAVRREGEVVAKGTLSAYRSGLRANART